MAESWRRARNGHTGVDEVIEVATGELNIVPKLGKLLLNCVFTCHLCKLAAM